MNLDAQIESALRKVEARREAKDKRGEPDACVELRALRHRQMKRDRCAGVFRQEHAA